VKQQLILRRAVLYATLRKIINAIWKLEHFDTEKLAKYLRCLLQATLSLDAEQPLKVIEEICEVVKQHDGVGGQQPHARRLSINCLLGRDSFPIA
jgi:hypothetical protein